jgi:hypothetical protein
MSKLIADNRHVEWDAAMIALICELDLPDRLLTPIRNLLDPGIGRVFFREWLLQERVDPETLLNPYDVADGEASPIRYRIDGEPKNGGTPAEIIARKWQSRAQVWFELYGLHIAHIIDWLVVSHERSQAWLQNVDARGEPKKLLKCRTLADLVAEATKGLRHRKIAPEIVLGPNDESFYADLGAGHTLVLLTSPAALRREGNRMHHCVGMGSYDGHIEDPDFHLLSVRDPVGKPLATPGNPRVGCSSVPGSVQCRPDPCGGRPRCADLRCTQRLDRIGGSGPRSILALRPGGATRSRGPTACAAALRKPPADLIAVFFDQK